MEIWDRKEWKKITEKTKADLSGKFLEFIDSVKASPYFSNKWNPVVVKAIAKFAAGNVENESDDLMVRLEKVLKLGRDSASLESFVLRYGASLGARLHAEKTTSTTVTKESLIAKHGLIEGSRKYDTLRLSKSHSLDGYVHRHGKIEGPKRFREYWNTTNFSTSKSAFCRRHGESDGYLKYEQFCKEAGRRSSGESWTDKEAYREMVRRRSQSIKGSDYSRDNISLEAFIRRLGEVEGKKEYLNYCNKLKKSLPNCVEYYLELGYDELQSAELVRKEQSKRLVSFGSASKESLRIFVSLYKYLRRLGLSRKEIWWGIGGSSEYFIKSKHRVCFYDFVIPKLKLIIEYNGSRYHPTKSTLKCEKKCRRIVGCKNIEDAKFKYKKDQQKLRIAKKNGFDVLVLWDTISTEENIAKVKKFVSKHV